MMKELYVVDEQGQVIDILGSKESYVKLNSGDRILRKKSIQYLSDTVDLKYHFIKINANVWDVVSIKYPIVNKLLRYIGYMDGILTYQNGKYVQIKDIAEICNVSVSTAKRQMNGLIKSDVIHKGKDVVIRKKYLIFNPFIAMRGGKIYKKLYDEFSQSEWKSKIEPLE